MASSFERLAEQRLRDAIESGELTDFAGKGEPLELEDLSRVPEELRASYCLLKSANVLPEEMQLKKEILGLSDLIAACEDDGERNRLKGERSALSLRFWILMEKRGRSGAFHEFADRVARRLS